MRRVRTLRPDQSGFEPASSGTGRRTSRKCPLGHPSRPSRAECSGRQRAGDEDTSWSQENVGGAGTPGAAASGGNGARPRPTVDRIEVRHTRDRGGGGAACDALPPTTPAGHPPRAHPRGSYLPSRSANRKAGAVSRPHGARARGHAGARARKELAPRPPEPRVPCPAAAQVPQPPRRGTRCTPTPCAHRGRSARDSEAGDGRCAARRPTSPAEHQTEAPPRGFLSFEDGEPVGPRRASSARGARSHPSSGRALGAGRASRSACGEPGGRGGRRPAHLPPTPLQGIRPTPVPGFPEDGKLGAMGRASHARGVPGFPKRAEEDYKLGRLGRASRAARDMLERGSTVRRERDTSGAEAAAERRGAPS